MRAHILAIVDEARASGARLEPCCEIVGVASRTLQRWRDHSEDGRQTAERPPSPNALSEDERARVLQVACSPAFRDLAPAQIVARLADSGEYIASESTFYRVLRRARMQRHRSHARPPVHKKPAEKVATGPNQVWSWDITYLRGPRRREFFYLYVVVDVWSRKIVGWAVHPVESGQLAARLVLEAFESEGRPDGLVLHSDRGAPMTSSALLGLLEHLQIRTSLSRPRVSDDNPYSEALFRTLKYRPAYPNKPFRSLEAATDWVRRFVGWYNDEHRHSAIGFVTPHQRHDGDDLGILEQRRALYAAAREAHPERWSGKTRSWGRPAVVALNPSDHTRQVSAM